MEVHCLQVFQFQPTFCNSHNYLCSVLQSITLILYFQERTKKEILTFSNTHKRMHVEGNSIHLHLYAIDSLETFVFILFLRRKENICV